MVSKAELKKLANNVGKVIDIFEPGEENVQTILDLIAPDIHMSDLSKALRIYYKYLEYKNNNDNVNAEKYLKLIDPLPVLFSKYTYLTTHMKATIMIGRRWWPYIQGYIHNPRYILSMLKDENVKNALSTELGNAYLNYYTQRLYDFFKLFFLEFPRYHNHCGGLILYRQIDKSANIWSFQCRKCLTPISMDKLFTETRKERYSSMKNKK